jgi:TldD protein
VDSASGHADYADVRFVHQRAEHLSTRNGELDELDSWDSAGIGVRVRLGGAWGFAAARGAERAGAEAALERALALAAAQPSTPAHPLTGEPPARGSYASPVEQDPFEVSLEDKLEALLAADESLRSQSSVAVTQARFLAFRAETVFASSEGALFDQTLTECGGGLTAVAACARRGSSISARSSSLRPRGGWPKRLKSCSTRRRVLRAAPR